MRGKSGATVNGLTVNGGRSFGTVPPLTVTPLAANLRGSDRPRSRTQGDSSPQVGQPPGPLAGPGHHHHRHHAAQRVALHAHPRAAHQSAEPTVGHLCLFAHAGRVDRHRRSDGRSLRPQADVQTRGVRFRRRVLHRLHQPLRAGAAAGRVDYRSIAATIGPSPSASGAASQPPPLPSVRSWAGF